MGVMATWRGGGALISTVDFIFIRLELKFDKLVT